MDENLDKETKEKEPAGVGKKKEDEKLPYCTQAASAEHAGGTAEEEPCDDARAGDYESK